MLRNENSKVTFLGRKVFHLLNYRWNLEKKSLRICGLKNNPHLCNAYHLRKARRLANNFAAGIFCVHGYTYSSVPCGVVNAPTAFLKVVSNGERNFFCFFPVIINILFHFNCLPK